MSTNKNAQLRYQILDRCFSDFHHRYTIDDLVAIVNETLTDLYGVNVTLRQIRADISNLRDRAAYNAPIETYPFDGRRSYYRYSDPTFSIFNNELTSEELTSLRSAINILSRFRSMPGHAWLEDVISSLEYRFGIKPNKENIVSFEQNEQLKGTEFLGELIDAAMNHQPLQVLYRTFAGSERMSIIHPYHVKQFNNRWFLIGLQQGDHGHYITNKALDRIVRITQANVPFIPNESIDFNEYFKDVVGVTLPEDHPEPEEVLLRFDAARFPYVVSKPIHPSQVVADEDKHIVRLTVRPNRELEACIFSFGPQVEVLQPLWLRKQIAEKIEDLNNKYSKMQDDCTINK